MKKATKHAKRITKITPELLKRIARKLGVPKGSNLIETTKSMLAQLLVLNASQITDKIAHTMGEQSCQSCGVLKDLTPVMLSTPFNATPRPHHNSQAHIKITWTSGWQAGCGLCDELRECVEEICKK